MANLCHPPTSPTDSDLSTDSDYSELSSTDSGTREPPTFLKADYAGSKPPEYYLSISASTTPMEAIDKVLWLRNLSFEKFYFEHLMNNSDCLHAPKTLEEARILACNTLSLEAKELLESLDKCLWFEHKLWTLQFIWRDGLTLDDERNVLAYLVVKEEKRQQGLSIKEKIEEIRGKDPILYYQIRHQLQLENEKGEYDAIKEERREKEEEFEARRLRDLPELEPKKYFHERYRLRSAENTWYWSDIDIHQSLEVRIEQVYRRIQEFKKQCPNLYHQLEYQLLLEERKKEPNEEIYTKKRGAPSWQGPWNRDYLENWWVSRNRVHHGVHWTIAPVKEDIIAVRDAKADVEKEEAKDSLSQLVKALKEIINAKEVEIRGFQKIIDTERVAHVKETELLTTRYEEKWIEMDRQARKKADKYVDHILSLCGREASEEPCHSEKDEMD